MRGTRCFALALTALLGCGGPERGACAPDPAPGELGSVCGFQNPEDVEWVFVADLLLVSEMAPHGGVGAGRVSALAIESPEARPERPRPLWPPAPGDEPAEAKAAGDAPIGDPACDTPPDPTRFSPHGITSRLIRIGEPVRVAVVSHAPREAVELFDLAGRGDAARLRWRGCIPLPPDARGNDLSFAPDGELLVTNYLPEIRGLRGLAYTLLGAGLGRDTGDLLAWRAGSGWRHIPESAGPMPNGVLASPDGRSAFVSESGSGKVVRLAIGRDAGGARAWADVGGNPDNLSRSPGGSLLVVTHTSGLGFLACRLGRLPCRSSWRLAAVDPERLRSREILAHEGDVIGAATSAAVAAGRVYLGSVFDDRVGVWHPPAPEALD